HLIDDHLVLVDLSLQLVPVGRGPLRNVLREPNDFDVDFALKRRVERHKSAVDDRPNRVDLAKLMRPLLHAAAIYALIRDDGHLRVADFDIFVPEQWVVLRFAVLVVPILVGLVAFTRPPLDGHVVPAVAPFDVFGVNSLADNARVAAIAESKRPPEPGKL